MERWTTQIYSYTESSQSSSSVSPTWRVEQSPGDGRVGPPSGQTAECQVAALVHCDVFWHLVDVWWNCGHKTHGAMLITTTMCTMWPEPLIIETDANACFVFQDWSRLVLKTLTFLAVTRLIAAYRVATTPLQCTCLVSPVLCCVVLCCESYSEHSGTPAKNREAAKINDWVVGETNTGILALTVASQQLFCSFNP